MDDKRKEELDKMLEEVSREETEPRPRDMMANCYIPAPPPDKDDDNATILDSFFHNEKEDENEDESTKGIFLKTIQ